MIVRFTIIDQRADADERLLPTSHSVFTGPTSNKAPATPYHLGRRVLAFAWYYSGWYGEWEIGGDICKATNVERVSQSKDVLQQFIVRIGFLGTCCAGSAVYDLWFIAGQWLFFFFFFWLVGWGRLAMRLICTSVDDS